MQESLIKIKGQDRALGFLKFSLGSGHISHAYIFNGPSGVGKMTAAIWFMAGVLCRQSRQGPCGACPDCRTVGKGSYPFQKIIYPEKNTIKIDQIRAIGEFLKYKVDPSTYRFVIIDEADTMTPEAANSLLKTLEEPPAQTTFILLVDNLSKVFSTIISRCQIVNFGALSRETMYEILMERGLEKPDIAAVLPVAYGSIGRALELMEDEDLQENRQKIISFLLGLPVSSRRILEFAQECSGLEISLVLDIILSCFRDLLVLDLAGKRQLWNPELEKKSGSKYGRAGLYRSIGSIMEAEQAAGQNANKQLVLENLFLELNAQAS